MRKINSFLNGVLQGIPIFLGYLSVSFGFGIMAVQSGLSVLESTLISLTNLTSAGQVAGVEVIASHGTIIEMILVQITINIRYSLMAISLSQKTGEDFSFSHRVFAAYGITDEIFGVSISQKEEVTPYFMYGLISIATLGWVGGTFLGAFAGMILPTSVSAALGIVLYGMFFAIFIPAAKKEKGVLISVCISAFLSCLCKYFLSNLSTGFCIIICAVCSALICAWIQPIAEKEDSAL